MALIDLLRPWKREGRPGPAPICDASCRLEARTAVSRSEATILTTRVR